jgi:ABC-type transport system involved in multi-copper enzyme maturation permease subunit
MEQAAPVENVKTPVRWNFIKAVMDNPVITKELRGRMRGSRAFILLTSYLALIALFIGLIYLFASSSAPVMRWDPSFRQGLGKSIFGTVVLLELLLVSFIGPGLTAGAITSEREHQTLDLLRISLLSARSLVLGKLGTAFVYLFLLILTALPIQSLAFLLGGVGLGEMIVSSLMLVVTAFAFCALGIFFSSFMKRTLTSTVSSYAAILTSFLALGMFFLLIAFFEASFSSFNPRVVENVMLVILWLLVSTNPMLAAIVSEVILIDQQNLFYTTAPFGTSSFSLPSPWIIYVLVYLLVSVLMVHLSIRFVSRPDR